MNHLEPAAVPADLNSGCNSGRKGIAYDWQSLLAAAEAGDLDRELAVFASIGALDVG